MEADHGALFETSVLAQLHPEMVTLENLPTKEEVPANDLEGNSKGNQRRDPNNVLFGVFGDDPRDYQEEQAKTILKEIINWVISETSNIE